MAGLWCSVRVLVGCGGSFVVFGGVVVSGEWERFCGVEMVWREW